MWWDSQQSPDPENGDFIQMDCLAAHIVRLLDERETDDLTAMFAVVDTVLKDGDAEARSVVSDGLLQALTKVGLYQGRRGAADRCHAVVGIPIST